MKPRVGATIITFANALEAVSELLTIGHEIHGGEWEGGRISDPDCINQSNDSMMRHFLAEGRGEIIDGGEGGTGMPHAVGVATNALMRLEKMIRDEKQAQKAGEVTHTITLGDFSPRSGVK